VKNSGVAQNALVQQAMAQKEMTQNSLAQNSARTCAHRKDARRTNSRTALPERPRGRLFLSSVSFSSLVILIISPAGEASAQSDQDWPRFGAGEATYQRCWATTAPSYASTVLSSEAWTFPFIAN